MPRAVFPSPNKEINQNIKLQPSETVEKKRKVVTITTTAGGKVLILIFVNYINFFNFF